MAKEKIFNVTSVELSLEKKNPPNLLIHAKGETASNGWTGPELQPWIYIEPPLDGVYDFDFVAQPPAGPSNPVITPIEAHYTWEDLPQDVRGIRVHSSTNCRTAWLCPPQSCQLIDFEDAEVVGKPPQYFLSVWGQKPYQDMRVFLVPLHQVPPPEYTPIEVIGCNGLLPAFAPYHETIALAGLIGTKGIEVIGAGRSKKIDVPGQARKIDSKAGVRAAAK